MAHVVLVSFIWILLGLTVLAFTTAACQTVRRSRTSCRGNPSTVTSHHLFRIPLGRHRISLGDSVLWHPWIRFYEIVDPGKIENGRPKRVGRGIQTSLFSISISRVPPYPWTDRNKIAEMQRKVTRPPLAGLEKALHHAIDYDNVEEVERLLRQGADIESRGDHGVTALIRAALGGNSEVFHLLVRHGAKLDVMDDYEITPLMDAVLSQNCGIVRFLLEKGADPNSRQEGEITALHWAVTSDSVEIVRMLLDYGAKIDAKERHSCDGTVLHRAIGDNRWANAEIVEELLKRGANVDELDRFCGSTVLMKAAGCGCARLVELLLAYGADPNIRGRDGSTALSRARAARRPEVVDVLRRAGALQ